MEDRIENSTQLLNIIFRSVVDYSIIVTDPYGKIMAFNRGAEIMLGYSESEVVNKHTPLIFYDKEEIDERSKELTEESGSPVNGFLVLAAKTENVVPEAREWKYIRKDGSSILVSQSVTAIRSDKNEINRYLVIAHDITGQKQKEEELKQSADKYFKAFNLNPSVISLTTASDGRYIDANEAFFLKTGFKREEIIGHTSFELGTWGGPDERKKYLDELSSNGKVKNLEIKFRVKSGELRTLLLSSEIVELMGRSCIFNYSHDITKFKRIEKELKESEEKFARAFNANPNVISITSMEDGRFIEVNDAYLRKTGYTRDEVIGRTSFDLEIWADPKDRSRYIEALKSNNGRIRDLEVRLKLKNGDIRDSLISSEMVEMRGKHYFFNYTLDVTDRKKAEAALKQSEERYRIVFEKSATANAILAENTIILLVNSNFETLFGYPREEIQGRMSWTSFVLEEYLEKMKKYNSVRRIDPDLAPQTYEFKGRVRSGEVKDFFMSVAMIPGTRESIVNIIDITERKRSEEALRRSEKKLSLIFENTPNAITITDINNGIVIAANRGVEWTGWKADEVIGNKIEKVLKWIIPLSWEKVVNTIINKGQLTNQQIEIIKKDGSVAQALMSSVLVEMDDRPHILTISTDITRLRESEEKFMKIFLSAPFCIAITRLSDGMILDANIAIERILGWKREEFIGSRSNDPDRNFWVDTEERDYMVDVLASGNEIIQREFFFRGKDGIPRPGIYSASAIMISGEASIIFILQDISGQRKLEDERRKLEEHLFHSQKMDAIGQIASGVAHDFNNILTGIQGNISLMMMEYDKNHHHYRRFHQIEEQVKRGANLTRQLLGFARGGKYEVKTISMNELIRKTSQFFLETRKDIRAELNLQYDLFFVEADAGQIEQVLINLFINSGQAMAGGGSLIVETKNVRFDEKESLSFNVQAGDYVMISVSDTGIGMDKETLMRVFEPFFTTKADKGGTGLGLASAYGIIRNHGGAVNVYSEQGKGSTFTLYLPSSQRKKVNDSMELDKGLYTGTGVILLVDDEELIIETASELLGKLGYKVYKAANGHEAVDIYREKHKKIDLVILDMIMPGMSGSDTLRILKEINPAVKIILSSGYGLQGDVRKVMESGCIAFIQKPFIFSDLSAIVYKALKVT